METFFAYNIRIPFSIWDYNKLKQDIGWSPLKHNQIGWYNGLVVLEELHYNRNVVQVAIKFALPLLLV